MGKSETPGKRSLSKKLNRSDKQVSKQDPLTLLVNAGAILSESLEHEETLNRVARVVVPDFADWCAVDLLDEDGNLRRLVVAHIDPTKVKLARELHKKYPPDWNAEHGATHVIRTGEPEMISDIPETLLKTVARDEEHLRILRDLNLRSYICTPLKARGRTFGAISFVIAESQRTYGRHELEVATELARRISQAIDNSRLYSELRESEQRYRNVIESQAEMLCRFQPDGTILFVNSAYARARGTTGETLMGGNFWDFITEEDRPRVQAMLDRLTPETPEIRIENRFETVDGERWTLWTNRALTFDDKGQWLEAQSAGIDITDRKQAEQTLQNQLRQLRTIYLLSAAVSHSAEVKEISEAALDGLIDAVNADRVSVLLFDDDGVMRFKGWRGLSEQYRQAVEGHTPWTPDDVDAIPIAVNDVCNDESLDDLRETILSEGIGALAFIPLVSGSRVLGKFMVYFNQPHEFTEDELQLCQTIAGQIAYAIERAQTEHALRENEERYRLSTSAGKVGVWDWDIVNNTITWSDMIYKIHGLEPGKFGGTVEAFAELVHPDDLEYVNQAIQRALHEDAAYELEFRAVRPDGEIVWIYTSAKVMRDASGAPVRMLGATVDITRRKQAELALREREERYELVVAGAEAAIWDWDVPAKRVDFSPRWKQLRGFAEDEISDSEQEWSKGIHPDDYDRVMAAVQAHFAGQTAIFAEEYRVRHKDGHWIWIHDRGIARRDETGQVIRMAGSETDITERKQAEEALRKSEERYRQLVGLLPIALYTCEAPSGIITFHNEHAATLWGRAPKPGDTDERFCGSFRLWRTDGTPLPHDQTPMAVSLREGRSFRNEDVVIERPDGTRINVLVNIDPILDTNGRVMGAINAFHDITALKWAEETQARLAAIVETSNDAIISKSLDGIIQSWNAGAERIFGYTAAEAVGQSIKLIIPSELHDEERSILERLRRGERIEPFETVRVSKTGRRIDISLSISPIIDESGRVVGASKVARDISDRKRAEAALKAKEAELELVAKTTPLILTRCSRDLRYLFVNRAAAALFGLTPEQIIGKPIVDIMGEDTLASIKPHIEKVLRGETVEYEAEIPYRGAGPRWMHVNYIPDHDEHGKVVGWVASIVDITERKRTEEALRKSEEALQEANQRKDEFLAMLAHELRNPLATIATSAITVRKNPSPIRRQNAVELIERQIAHLRQLVDDLLDVTRLSRGKVKLKKQDLEFGEQMQAAVHSVSSLIKQKGHKLKWTGPDTPVFVKADQIRLQQILVNVLHNAAKFTDNGGKIWFTASKENGYIVCRCRDNGRGIEPEKLPHLFEPFMQLDTELHRQEAGLGIGLAMVKQLVKLHGGSVKVNSAGRGKGTEFAVRLPVATPAHQPKRVAAKSIEKKFETRKRHILIVEDNDYFAEALKDLLEDEGHHVCVVDNGHDAIARAREKQPDVILLDIGLPGQDGYMVAQQIKEAAELEKILLIAMSGYDQDKHKSKGLFDDYFVKSADPNVLLEILQKDNG